MSEWFSNILISVLGAGVWSALVLVAKAYYERSGALAGLWYQVTYYADDPAMRGVPWSVELMRVRHHRQSVSGHIWRIHGPYLDRKWSFVGRYSDGCMDGTYWSVKGGGGRGSLHLWRVSDNNLRGRFVESQLVHDGPEMSIVYLEAPLEWIRLGSHEERRVLPWLELDKTAQMEPYMPKYMIQALRQGVARCYGEGRVHEANDWRRQLLEGLGYAGALVDLTGPLAMEAEKRRRATPSEKATASPGELIAPEQPAQSTDDPESGEARS
ncbi:hypothetical protein MF672_050205 [Actinomadura sp. ATCC 31491]|uniref:Uncharacterized protein n=1 Tax=Actinomadura luzonensis TaxID=2805427 RepID=A0ABT0GBJ0_9ACTN|nr:hypothetical protein [Actinomadura luzonensis]MCK2221931.1 hypothetical protein [Actinomadura luzonensis]